MDTRQRSRRLGARLAPLALALVLAPELAQAAVCDVEYTVQAGDTYYSVAEAHYGSRSNWQHVYKANQSASGLPSLIPGNALYIPCLAGQVPVTEVTPTAAAGVATQKPAPVPEALETVTRSLRTLSSAAAPAPKVIERTYPENAELKLLTGGNYAPFTDKTLPEQGLATELVHAALDLSPSPTTYAISWDDNWGAHFNALTQKTHDMGFPWVRPDCEATPGHPHCETFHFSDPLMTMPVMLFVRQDNQFRHRGDADVVGRTLCRPEGFFTHDLDRADRRWLTDGLVTFVRGTSPGDCFEKVVAGEVDAATVNLFLGASVILEMGLRNVVVPLETPLSEEGLHVVISKRHWRGTVHLYRVNAGLAKLREDGRYQEIVSRHLELFQSRLQ